MSCNFLVLIFIKNYEDRTYESENTQPKHGPSKLSIFIKKQPLEVKSRLTTKNMNTVTRLGNQRDYTETPRPYARKKTEGHPAIKQFKDKSIPGPT